MLKGDAGIAQGLEPAELFLVLFKNELVALFVKLLGPQVQGKGHQLPGLYLVAGDALFPELGPKVEICVVDGSDHVCHRFLGFCGPLTSGPRFRFRG